LNKLITFEGIDGSGKSTQIRLLCEKFDKLGIQYISVREPGGTTISEKIRDILLDKKNLELSNTSESLLFLSARSQLVSEKIIPALQSNKFVICDRYTDSTIAYQGYGRNLNVEMLTVLNNYATQNLHPELTFVLDVDIETSIYRRKVTDDDRMESSGIQFMKDIRDGYHQMAGKDPKRIKVLDGNMDPFKIFQKIWFELELKFKEI
jgi:dTMP kinase